MNLFDCETIHINKIYSVEKYSGYSKLLSTKEYGNFFKTYEIVPPPLPAAPYTAVSPTMLCSSYSSMCSVL